MLGVSPVLMRLSFQNLLVSGDKNFYILNVKLHIRLAHYHNRTKLILNPLMKICNEYFAL